MADTLQPECQAEPTSTQPEALPSEALYMDFETAMYHAQALFSAIHTLASGPIGEHSSVIYDLASLGESIIEDQLKSSVQE